MDGHIFVLMFIQPSFSDTLTCWASPLHSLPKMQHEISNFSHILLALHSVLDHAYVDTRWKSMTFMLSNQLCCVSKGHGLMFHVQQAGC